MIGHLYSRKASVIHRANFWPKFLSLLMALPAAAIAGSLPVLGLTFFGFAALVCLTRIGLRRFWTASKIYLVAFTVSVVSLTLIFYRGDLVERLAQGVLLAIRFAVLVGSGVLFAMTTDPIEIPFGLLQLGLPHKYGVTLMVALRMFPLVSSRAQEVRDAQRARGLDLRLSLKALPSLPSHLVSLMVPLIYASLEKSVELSDTLTCRGYDPEGQMTTPPVRLGVIDMVLIVTAAGLVALTSLLR